MKRAARCAAILASLPYVDRKRICAYGSNAGANLTLSTAGNMPGKIAAAAITAGGIGGRFTGSEIAGKIRYPFPTIHGGADPIVSPESHMRQLKHQSAFGGGRLGRIIQLPFSELASELDERIAPRFSGQGSSTSFGPTSE